MTVQPSGKSSASDYRPSSSLGFSCKKVLKAMFKISAVALVSLYVADQYYIPQGPINPNLLPMTPTPPSNNHFPLIDTSFYIQPVIGDPPHSYRPGHFSRETRPSPSFIFDMDELKKDPFTYLQGLISKGLNIDETLISYTDDGIDKSAGVPLLLYAMVEEDENLLKALLQLKVDPNGISFQKLEFLCDIEGLSFPAARNAEKYLRPLNLAIVKNNIKMAILLLEYGANPNSRSFGDVEFRKKLPLNVAIDLNRLDMISLLIDHGASLNFIDFDFLFSSRNMIEELKLLIKKGLNVNQIIEAKASLQDGWKSLNGTFASPLHFAIFDELDEVVKLLIDNNADIEATEDKNSRTPLHWACEFSNYKAAKLLLECGANVFAEDVDGSKPIELASHKGIKDLINAKIAVSKVPIKKQGPPSKLLNNGFSFIKNMFDRFKFWNKENNDNNFWANFDKKSKIEAEEKDRALLMFSANDHNGAFRELKFQRNLREDFNITKRTVLEFREIIEILKEQPKESLDLFVLSAHGTMNSMEFGQSSRRKFIIDNFFANHFLNPELKEALKAMKPNGTIILNSCSTAKEWDDENVLDYFLRHAPQGIEVCAPNTPAGLKEISKPSKKAKKLEITYYCDNCKVCKIKK